MARKNASPTLTAAKLLTVKRGNARCTDAAHLGDRTNLGPISAILGHVHTDTAVAATDYRVEEVAIVCADCNERHNMLARANGTHTFTTTTDADHLIAAYVELDNNGPSALMPGFASMEQAHKAARKALLGL